MLSIFIPQDTLEDILIDNMPSDMEPEDQDVWYKIIINQEVIYVSSWDDTKYPLDEDPLMKLSNSFGVEVRTETPFFEAVPDNHKLVTQYKNGIFLLDIPEEEAAEIQRDYGVICQSIDNMDASVLMDQGLRYSPKENDEKYTWYYMLERISAEHIPSNHLIMIDRYLFAENDKIESTLDNIFYILDTMLPHHQLKCPYKVTIFYGEQKEGSGVGISQAASEVYKIIPDLERSYDINVEVIYVSHLCELYKPFHNRRILTNYTITQLEHKLNALEKEKSTCQQTVLPQRLFTLSGLAGYCDSPHKMHHDLMSYINDYLIWWTKNFLSPKSVYSFNGQVKLVNKRYEVEEIGKKSFLYEKKC